MKPVVIFGEVPEDFKNKVFELRKKVTKLGYDSGENYVYTVPHLTLAVNTKFEGDVDRLKTLAEELNIKKFSLKTEDLIIIDKNAAVKFSNSYSVKLAKEITFALRDFNFEPIETYFMKLIRSEIKPEFQEKVKEMLEEIIPEEIEILRISAAGGNLTEEDIFWSINLKAYK